MVSLNTMRVMACEPRLRLRSCYSVLMSDISPSIGHSNSIPVIPIHAKVLIEFEGKLKLSESIDSIVFDLCRRPNECIVSLRIGQVPGMCYPQPSASLASTYINRRPKFA